jgi:hypothetical protein
MPLLEIEKGATGAPFQLLAVERVLRGGYSSAPCPAFPYRRSILDWPRAASPGCMVHFAPFADHFSSTRDSFAIHAEPHDE